MKTTETTAMKIVIILLKVNCTLVQCILKLLGKRRGMFKCGMELTEPVAQREAISEEVKQKSCCNPFSL
jgi:hypothetical protein